MRRWPSIEAIPDCPVFAPKSYYGYIGPGSDFVDLSMSILAVKHQLLPPTLNYDRADPQAPAKIQRHALPMSNPLILSLGFTPAGQVTCLVVDAS